MPLPLETTNEQFEIAAADLIEKKGTTKGQYEDKWSGGCCTLGAFRILIFGRTDIYNLYHGTERYKRYYELAEHFAKGLKMPGGIDWDPQTVISKWHDGSTKDEVITRLREVGGAS